MKQWVETGHNELEDRRNPPPVSEASTHEPTDRSVLQDPLGPRVHLRNPSIEPVRRNTRGAVPTRPLVG